MASSTSDELEFFDAVSESSGCSSAGKSEMDEYVHLSKVDLDSQFSQSLRNRRPSGSVVSNDSKNEQVFSDISGDGYSDEPSGGDLAPSSIASEQTENAASSSAQDKDENLDSIDESIAVDKASLSKPSAPTAPAQPSMGLSSIIKKFLGLSAEPKKSRDVSNIRVRAHNKDSLDFQYLVCTQSIVNDKAHPDSTIWCMKFSHDSAFLATGNSEGRIVIWSVGSLPRHERTLQGLKGASSTGIIGSEGETTSQFMLLTPVCYRVLDGHSKEVIDLSWSPRDSRLLLSASMDRSVRLWVIEKGKPPSYFRFLHPDLVTSVDFHPTLDVFVSGCFDKKIRIWDVSGVGKSGPNWEPDEEFKDSVKVPEIITSVSFDADGHMVAAGIAKGQVVFFTYNEDGLRYNTKLECKNRRGQYHLGTNITGLSFFCDSVSTNMTNELLVSCNDSRIRLVNLDDFSVYSKLKGVQNTSMPIKATFSEDGKYVISGSDTGFVGIWGRHNPTDKPVKDKVLRNNIFETFDGAGGTGVATVVAIFVPAAAVTKATEINSGVYVLDRIPELSSRLIVTADYSGQIRVYSRGLED